VRAKRQPLTRDLIAAAALDLLDAEGPAGLTMRRLAQLLGVRAPSLYNHVTGQDEIVDLIHELVDTEIDLTVLLDDDLGRGLAAFARSYRAAYLRHPHALPLVVRRPITSPTALAVYDRAAAALQRHGIADGEVLGVLAMLDHLVLGATVDTFSAGFAAASAYRSAFPALATTLSAADRGTVDDAAFEHGLALLLADVRARLDRVTLTRR